MAKRATLEGRDLLFRHGTEGEDTSAAAATEKPSQQAPRDNNQEIQKSREPEALEKVSFRLSPRLITRLARAKVELREWGVKVNKEEIVAQALVRALDDLEKNHEHSDLARSFSRNQD